MLRVKVLDAKIWKNLMTAISAIVDEGVFEFAPDAMSLRAMDPSHVAMVEFSLPKDVFEEFVCDKPTKVCINISEMLKLLRGVGVGESLEISFDEERGRLRMKVKGRYLRIFDLATLEVPEETVPEPRFTFNASVRLPSSDFVRALADAGKVSDHARLEIDNEKFAIAAAGDLGSIKVEFAKGSETIMDFSIKEPSKASYSLRYLIDITKGAALTSDKVTIEYSTDRPIKLDFEMPKGHLRFYLAPRIEAV